MKRAVVSVGNGNHEMLDNLITLSKSNNDIYDGINDYIYFRVLNVEPIEYFNLTKRYDVDKEYYEWEIEMYQNDFFNYENKNNFSEKIKNDIEEIVKYIRRKALKNNLIKEVLKDKYIENSNTFNSDYITKKIIKYYKEK